jgi:hypothetical protein
MIAAGIIVAAFFAGAFTGLLALLRLGMIREQRKLFSTAPRTRVTAASRVVTGLYVRRPEALVQPRCATVRLASHQGRPLTAIPGVQRISVKSGMPEINGRRRELT